MVRSRNRFASLNRIAALLLGALGTIGLTGCHLATGSIEPAPVSAAEQRMQILEIVPVGTPRDEAVRRLEAAGIEGGYGATGAESTYYCDVWNRPDGERWHIDVAVLFDDDGRVWIARSGSTSVTPLGTRTTRLDD